ncbi:photosynthesis system II assembly factor YCF48-like protein [Luteimonas cucumeris]|uniref:Photosynthesis system II assembly factor YCF48-like protein n=1 Tax=Luteimonas cucumeris TaxID=985012 RepID=A0A562KZU3_9GAMM|nr:oxidoreductase [Luteimonas cucumeris]TWI00915.1 photosynthesis system II assembly factor YCF48-like protein [Luteimonas cucumeris]
MSPTRILIAAAMLLAANAAGAEVRILPQDSGVEVRLRGISAVSDDVAWASGREGTVLRTVDGGKHWQVIKVPDADELDFRDVEGFDADTAVVLSIGPGEASRVYRTEDGGRSWQLALQNKDPRAFLDCMTFDDDQGWMMGDPVEGRFQIYGSNDAGRNWRLLPDGPKADQDEAAFAASGTCIAAGEGKLAVITGGSRARAHVANRSGAPWLATNAAGLSAAPSRGYFSATAFGSGARMLLVGGDYEHVEQAGIAALLEPEDSSGLRLVELPAPRAYRSGAGCNGGFCVVVGPAGVDSWNGKVWQALSDISYDAVDLSGNVGWASGDGGRIARIEVSE